MLNEISNYMFVGNFENDCFYCFNLLSNYYADKNAFLS